MATNPASDQQNGPSQLFDVVREAFLVYSTFQPYDVQGMLPALDIPDGYSGPRV